MATRKFKRISVGEIRQLLPTKDGKPPKKSVEQFVSTTLKKLFDAGDKIKASAVKVGIIEERPSSLKNDAEQSVRRVLHTSLDTGLNADAITKLVNETPEVYLYFTLTEGLQESVEKDKTKTQPKVEASSASSPNRPLVFNRVNNRQRKLKQERVAEPRLPQQTTKKPRTKTAPKQKTSQVKAKYAYDPDVVQLAMQYAGVTTAVDPEDQLELVNEYGDALKKGLVPENLWPPEKWLKTFGYNLRDIRKIRDAYVLKGPTSNASSPPAGGTTDNGLPLSAPTAISKEEKKAQKEKDARINELKASRENIGLGSRPNTGKGTGIISSMMNMVPLGILSGIGGDIDELLSSGKTYEREQQEDRELKAALKLEGVDVEAEDLKAKEQEEKVKALAEEDRIAEEKSESDASRDKWYSRGNKLGSVFKSSSPLQSINQSTTDAKQTILNSAQNTELTNTTINNRQPNLRDFIGPSKRGPDAERTAEVRAQNMRTTNNIVNSANSIDPAKSLTPPPSMLSPDTSAIETAAEVKEDESVASLDSIDEGVKKMVDLLSVIGPSLRGEQGPPQPQESGGSGDLVSGIVDTVGSSGKGAIGLSGLGLAAAGTAAAVGVAGAGQAIFGEDGVARGGSGNNFINDAVGGRNWQKEDPKEVEKRGQWGVAEVNEARIKAGKEPFTAEEFEAIKNKGKAKPVATEVKPAPAATPVASDVTPTPAKNAVLQQGIEASQDKSIKLAAEAAAKSAAPPASPGGTTNNSTINNQSTTSLSMRPQPRNNDSPWNRYQESRYQ